MKKRRDKIIQISHRDEADFYKIDISFSTETIKENLQKLYGIAAYNSEMEDPFLREFEADDLRRNTEYLLEQIATDVDEIIKYVR